MLKEHTAVNAAYNSRERELENASTCQEGTRQEVVGKISAWSMANDNRPICWLQGPAGSGKSTVAHTIAKQCDDARRLAFSFFFSRGKRDRSDTIKFFPTFAHQLATFFPALQPSMREALASDSSIPFQSLDNQIKKLIINPLRPHLTSAVSNSPMVIVVDGLDECGEEALLPVIVQLLVDTANALPFRLLFTSRLETPIEQTFKSPLTRCKTNFLSLWDFNAHADIRTYLHFHLSEIYEKENQLMRGVPKPWPSPKEFKVLVEQSGGLFIYVSTLVKFVGDGNGLPHEKLKAVMKVHKGVDPLYHQVISVARRFEDFERVVGAIVYLREVHTVNDLGLLLSLPPSSIRLALRGCQSVFKIPEGDFESVQPYHVSLRDFLTDRDRSRSHFLDPMMHHMSITVGCLRLIGTHMENDAASGGQVKYACLYWCLHLASALSCGTTIAVVDAKFGDEMAILVEGMKEQPWSRRWIYHLGRSSVVKTVSDDLEAALGRIAVGLVLHDSGFRADV
jgi:hypothetical protein